jgi:hypothetical protein
MDEFDDPKLALEAAKVIMDGMKRKALNYVGEWNQIMVYLERQVAKNK